jgi:hypothetical protein
MKSTATISRWLGLAALALAGAAHLAAATATLYATRFESDEGFSTELDLAGQGGWVSDGSGGNGVVSNYISGLQQQAYVGFSPPAPGVTSLSLWRPVNFVPSNAALVRFSVELSVMDSSTTNRDGFYWSIYNRAGHRLCGVLFDNRDLGIWRDADDGYLYSTGWGFENGSDSNGVYTLQLLLNFTANRWDAFVNGTQVITNQLITTVGAALDFGDADAEWVLGAASAPGDNYMLFDNYSVTADPIPQVIPTLQPPIAVGGGQRLIRVTGRNGVAYAIEGSTNLTHWTSLKTNVVNGTYFDYTDPASAVLTRRYYRARWVP